MTQDEIVLLNLIDGCASRFSIAAPPKIALIFDLTFLDSARPR